MRVVVPQDWATRSTFESRSNSLLWALVSALKVVLSNNPKCLWCVGCCRFNDAKTHTGCRSRQASRSTR